MGSSIVVKSNQDGNSFKNRSAGRGYNREYRGNRQNRRGGYGPRFNNRGNNFNQNFQQQQPLKMEQYPCRYTLLYSFKTTYQTEINYAHKLHSKHMTLIIS